MWRTKHSNNSSAHTKTVMEQLFVFKKKFSSSAHQQHIPNQACTLNALCVYSSKNTAGEVVGKCFRVS